jgi:hypothetical protein
MQPEIKRRANVFLNILNNGISSTDFQINKNCKNCEFNTPDNSRNGYAECWGKLAYTEPNIFDLYYGGSIGHYTKGFYLDELILERKTSLYDIDPERLKNAKGELGSRGTRQQLQLENTKTNTEWISPEIKKYNQDYPLHCIDYETYTGALQFH